MAGLQIIIIGAGVGGPAAAIGLVRNGHKVTLYERSTSTSEVGFAFRITPNSDRCLKFLGIDIEAGGAVAANTGRMMDAEGHIFHEMKENEDQTKRGISVFAYRSQVNRQMLDVTVKSGVKIKTGIKVKSVDTANSTVELDDGTTVSADLIIAADGVYSVVKPYIIDTKKYFPRGTTGHNAFRFMVPKPLLQKDELLCTLMTDDARMFSWNGDGRRILVYPVDFSRQFNIVCTHSASLSDKEAESDSTAAVAYNQKVSFATVMDIYRDFEPRAKRLLELADPDGFRVWKLEDMDEIPRWSDHHTVLLGDSAHPLLPFSFSGASMAIEDAVTLSIILPIGTEREEIPRRLELYEKIRKPRIERVRETGRLIGKGENDEGFVMAYMRFLSTHDVVGYAREKLDSFLSSGDY